MRKRFYYIIFLLKVYISFLSKSGLDYGEYLILLVILSQVGEAIGLDKALKVNTVKTRTHSLFRQGQFYYRFFFRFTQREQDRLMEQFEQLLQQQNFWYDLLS